MRAIEPAIKVLVSSGYFREELADGLVARGAVGFLQKPYRLTTLAEELKKVLG
jgi:DNA-binding NarL/FixJ family response regulator